jgi:hypothetical protein
MQKLTFPYMIDDYAIIAVRLLPLHHAFNQRHISCQVNPVSSTCLSIDQLSVQSPKKRSQNSLRLHITDTYLVVVVMSSCYTFDKQQ